MVIETRGKVRTLLGEGKTVSEIAAVLGLTKSTVCFHRRRLGYPVESKFARRHDWQAIQCYYDEGHSKRECQAQFGFSSKTWYDAVERGAIAPRPAAAPIENYLVKGRKVNRYHLKNRLLSAGIKHPACERCRISTWLGRELSIALHHINGDGNDNRLENLQLLCPNCHSQTSNFGSRNASAARGKLANRLKQTGMVPIGQTRRLPVVRTAC